MIQGISHITFLTRDLDRMEDILVTILGARKVYDSGAEAFSLSPERFFLIGDGDRALWIAIMHGDPPPGRSYDHIAFRIENAGYEGYLARIRDLGLERRADRPRIAGEGRSIYFYDDDNHLFELHTGTLAPRLARYSREVPHATPAAIS